MDISIIIVNWNTLHYLEQSLSSIYANLPSNEFDVWVVDNASTDGSPQMVMEGFPQVHLIENKQNVGFARANNQAIRKSRGRFVWLLNSDTKVKPNALDHLFNFMQLHSDAGAAGSMYQNPDGSLQTSCYPLPTLSREIWRLLHLDNIRPYGVYTMDKWSISDPKEVEVLQGASLILRRVALDQVGAFDEDYFMYTEEVDLCNRLIEGGWSLFWVPQSQVIHYGGQSTQLEATRMFLSLYQTKILYFRKNHGDFAAFIYKLILLGTSLARLAISPLAWLKPPFERNQYIKLTQHYMLLLKKLPGM